MDAIDALEDQLCKPTSIPFIEFAAMTMQQAVTAWGRSRLYSSESAEKHFNSVARKFLVDGLGLEMAYHINYENVIEFLRRYSRGHAVQTVNTGIVMFRSFAKHYASAGVDQRIATIKQLKVPTGKPRALTPQALYGAFRDVMKEGSVNLVIGFNTALYTGLRKMELFSLELDSINLPAREILIQPVPELEFLPKSRNFRKVPIHDDLYVILKKTWSKRKYLLESADGRPYARINEVDHELRAIFDKNGVKRGDLWHSLRHTFATYYLQAGGNIRTLQNILGHADVKTTEEYLGAADVRSMVNEMRSVKFRYPERWVQEDKEAKDFTGLFKKNALPHIKEIALDDLLEPHMLAEYMELERRYKTTRELIERARTKQGVSPKKVEEDRVDDLVF